MALGGRSRWCHVIQTCGQHVLDDTTWLQICGGSQSATRLFFKKLPAGQPPLVTVIEAVLTNLRIIMRSTRARPAGGPDIFGYILMWVGYTLLCPGPCWQRPQLRLGHMTFPIFLYFDAWPRLATCGTSARCTFMACSFGFGLPRTLLLCTSLTMGLQSKTMRSE